MIDRIFDDVRKLLLNAVSNVSLFVFTAFLVTGILHMEPLVRYHGQINLFNQYVVFPWGMALCLLRLERRVNTQQQTERRDILVLFALLLWIIIPFAVRFGLTFNNISSWYNHAVVYFGIYAYLSEKPTEEREKLFDQMLWFCCLLSLVMGSSLLYCAGKALSIQIGEDTMPFGLFWDGYMNSWYLAHGFNPNMTGMICLSLLMLCLAGAARSSSRPMRLLYALSAAMMAVIIVLTQSRTARYAMLGALATGIIGTVESRSRISSALIRRTAAAILGVVCLIVGFAVSDGLTRGMLEHYEKIRGVLILEETAQQEDGGVGQSETLALKPKDVVDGSFSERTSIWANLLEL